MCYKFETIDIWVYVRSFEITIYKLYKRRKEIGGTGVCCTSVQWWILLLRNWARCRNLSFGLEIAQPRV